MKKREIIFIIGTVLSVVLFVFIFKADFSANIYNSISVWLDKKSGINPFWPDLRTNKDLWLNGYLGIFLRFDKFGFLNWLAIPLIVYFLVTVRKRERWEIALCLALCISCLFFCTMGYGYPRYQLTIFPLLITAIFLFGWQVVRATNNRALFVGIILFCLCVLLGNYYVLGDTYAYYWKGSTGHGNPGERFPYKLIEYVNKNVGTGSGIMEYESPILSYHAIKRKNIPGQGKDTYVLIRNKSVGGSYDLIYKDQGYSLYKKVDNIDQLYNDLYDSISSKKSLIKNGSFENWRANHNVLPNFWHIYGQGSVQKEKSNKKLGKYAVKITGDRFNFYQNVTLHELAPGKKVTCFAWINTRIPDKYRIEIYDGIDSSISERHTGDGKWQILRVTHSVNPLATSIELRVVQANMTGGVNDVVYVDGVLLLSGEYLGPSNFLMEHCRQ
jgi:hypothetical protein